MRHRGSLRRLLSTWLVAPLVGLILLSSIPAYNLAVQAANDAYDDSLLSPAIAIARYVRLHEERFEVDLPPVALDALRVDSVDRVFFQVTGPDGDLIAGNAMIPPPSRTIAGAGQMFYSSRVNAQRVRVAAVSVPRRHGEVLVQVAETTDKRDRLVQKIVLGALAPAVIVALAAAALFWFGIRRGLAPLDRLRRELEQRSPAELRPVPDLDAPDEVRPLVHALNRLLGRLEGALGAQQRFIANAAHQLRTPLSGLKTHVELARRENPTGETRAILDMIAGETERATHLANQLLTLARAEPGSGLPAVRQPVNLREVVHRAARDWVRLAHERNIDLGFELKDAWTLGDPMLLRELLANLIDNALAYSPAGSTATVRTEVRSGSSILEVEDNGSGIPAAERERVFERFYRVPGTSAAGCGLGLAIVREIAESHGGGVTLETPQGGTGTLVSIALPSADAENETGRSKTGRSKTSRA